MASYPASKSDGLCPRELWTLIAVAAFTVGNIYLAQPLLANIAESFGETPGRVGMIPALAQIGYVLALVFVAPLGDVLSPRRLLSWLLGTAGLALSGAALTTDFSLFCLASFAVGLTAVQAQVALPYIAARSTEKERARNMGLFMSACLTGVLLSRTLSGYFGQHLPSWRLVFLFWGVAMLVLAKASYRTTPTHPAGTAIPYPQLVGSLLTIFLERKALRSIAMTGALAYGALSVFWATLAFHLGGPTFSLGSDAVGGFGLLGIGGALASGAASRWLDRVKARSLLLASVLLMALSFLGMGLSGGSLLLLVGSAVFLDVGAQTASISNQSEIYRLYPDARSRLNTIYKVFYFSGGALGSILSAAAWQQCGWWGVCFTGIGFLLLAGLNIKRQPG